MARYWCPDEVAAECKWYANAKLNPIDGTYQEFSAFAE